MALQRPSGLAGLGELTMFASNIQRSSAVRTTQRFASTSSKKQSTNPRAELHRFLGPKNFKGLYRRNPLAFTPDYHKYTRAGNYVSSYPITQQDRAGPAVRWQQVFKQAAERRDAKVGSSANGALKPFADNPFCKSAVMIPDSLKKSIVSDHASGMSTQAIGFRYQIALPRVEAILRLHDVEKSMLSEEKITREMRKMADTMKSMFSTVRTDRETGLPAQAVDNMTEIPIPKETRRQRFLSIAESEPFGPVDAASALGIEPASTTLEKLTRHDEETDASAKAKAAHMPLSFVAPVLEGERTAFRFTDAKVGEVGHRYGASKDDRRHARRVRYQADGTMVWG